MEADEYPQRRYSAQLMSPEASSRSSSSFYSTGSQGDHFSLPFQFNAVRGNERNFNQQDYQQPSYYNSFPSYTGQPSFEDVETRQMVQQLQTMQIPESQSIPTFHYGSNSIPLPQPQSDTATFNTNAYPTVYTDSTQDVFDIYAQNAMHLQQATLPNNSQHMFPAMPQTESLSTGTLPFQDALMLYTPTQSINESDQAALAWQPNETVPWPVAYPHTQRLGSGVNSDLNYLGK